MPCRPWNPHHQFANGIPCGPQAKGVLGSCTGRSDVYMLAVTICWLERERTPPVRVTPRAGQRQHERGYLCPVDVPLTVLGGKWKLLIGFFLLQQPRRNSELRRLMPPISQKMLTQQLR